MDDLLAKMERLARADVEYGTGGYAEVLDRAQQEIERLRGLLWYGWHEMNAIRARSGVPLGFDGRPLGIVEDYWSDVVEAMQDALGEDAQPWPSPAARAALKGDG